MEDGEAGEDDVVLNWWQRGCEGHGVEVVARYGELMINGMGW
jgi:hypothetical protein